MIASVHRIRRLCFRAPPGNPLAARRALEDAVDGASSRLGKEAVLCVRRLAVSPSRLDERMRRALEQEQTEAARPALGSVPVGANAVFFADRAEMLACLAHDWCAEGLAARWWWPLLLPKHAPAQTVVNAWLAEPRAVPWAVARLAAGGLAGRFFARLSPGETATLWREVVRTFDLHALETAWNRQTHATGGGAPSERSVAVPAERPPWEPWIGVQPALPDPGLRLLVSALLIQQAPGVVRSTAFVREVARWRRNVPATVAPENPPDEPASDAPPGAPLLSEVARLPPPATPMDSTDSAASVQAPHGIDGHAGVTPMVPTDIAASVPSSVRQIPTPNPSAPPGMGGDIRSDPLPPEVRPSMFAPMSPSIRRIVSRWGGIFYLVNVALALEIYGDFTSPAHPGLALPLWDFLALMGGRMIGEEFISDPLAALLADLAGRDGDEPPGVWFEPPEGDSLARWTERMAARLDERLALALGIAGPEPLHTLVLRHRAEIETTETRVDVRFSLDAHPIELRLAGLDRDPGWVPAGGRSLAFHYD